MGQDCYLTGFGQNEYVCDCGSRNGFSRIGPTCETTPDGITGKDGITKESDFESVVRC